MEQLINNIRTDSAKNTERLKLENYEILIACASTASYASHLLTTNRNVQELIDTVANAAITTYTAYHQGLSKGLLLTGIWTGAAVYYKAYSDLNRSPLGHLAGSLAFTIPTIIASYSTAKQAFKGIQELWKHREIDPATANVGMMIRAVNLTSALWRGFSALNSIDTTYKHFAKEDYKAVKEEAEIRIASCRRELDRCVPKTLWEEAWKCKNPFLSCVRDPVYDRDLMSARIEALDQSPSRWTRYFLNLPNDPKVEPPGWRFARSGMHDHHYHSEEQYYNENYERAFSKWKQKSRADWEKEWKRNREGFKNGPEEESTSSNSWGWKKTFEGFFNRFWSDSESEQKNQESGNSGRRDRQARMPRPSMDFYRARQIVFSEGFDGSQCRKVGPEQYLGKQFRRLAIQYHPDKCPTEDCKTKMIELNNAWEALEDRVQGLC